MRSCLCTRLPGPAISKAGILAARCLCTAARFILRDFVDAWRPDIEEREYGAVGRLLEEQGFAAQMDYIGGLVRRSARGARAGRRAAGLLMRWGRGGYGSSAAVVAGLRLFLCAETRGCDAGRAWLSPKQAPHGMERGDWDSLVDEELRAHAGRGGYGAEEMQLSWAVLFEFVRLVQAGAAAAGLPPAQPLPPFEAFLLDLYALVRGGVNGKEWEGMWPPRESRSGP